MIRPHAIVGDSVFIGAYSIVGTKSRIRNDAYVGRCVRIFPHATIGAYVKLIDHVRIGGKWEETPLQIQGSKNVVYVSEPGLIGVGCQIHSPKWWQREYRDLGNNHDYTEEQIEEYAMYLDFARTWMQRQGCFESVK